MRKFVPVFVIVVFVILSGGCTKEEDDDAAYMPPSISFKTDSGYTYIDDTLPRGAIIRMGVTVLEGSEHLYTFWVNRTYDTDQPQRVDSMNILEMPFYYDTVVVLRNQPGVERWSFIAVEGNGDRTQRQLTFTAY